MDGINEAINDMHRAVEFGVVNLQLKKHAGHVASIDGNKVTAHKVSGNVEALTIVGTIIKNTSIVIKKDMPEIPPTLTFTVFYRKDGEIDRVNVNDFKRIAFNKNQ